MQMEGDSPSRDSAVEAAELVRARIGEVANGRVQSSRDVGAKKFVNRFFKASRLHFIGTWNERYSSLLETLPPPPAFPKYNDTDRCVLHVDMDAFFASVATRERPQYKDLPVAVCWSTNSGNTGKNSEISCANYKARSYGVKAGQWTTTAKEHCPELVFFPFEFEKYAQTALDMYQRLFALTPFVIGLSCDEAFVDITHLVNAETDIGTREQRIRSIANTLRKDIFDVTKGCTVSIGASHSRLLARIATAKAKPNGFFHIAVEDAASMISSLPVKGLPSVGYRTMKVLASKNIATCGDLQRLSVETLRNIFGEKNGLRLYEYARGIDKRPWNQVVERKTISAQISWGVRMENDKEVKDFLQQLSVKVVERLIKVKSKQTGAKSITLKIWRAIENPDNSRRKGHLGHGQCDILNKKASLSVPTNDPKLIAKQSFQVYKDMKVLPGRVRGLGIALSDFGKPYSLLQRGFLKRKAESAPAATEVKSVAKQVPVPKDRATRKHSPQEIWTDQGSATEKKSLSNSRVGKNAAPNHQSDTAILADATYSFAEMQNRIVEKLRLAKLGPLIQPHLGEVDCDDDFCDGGCTSLRCFQFRFLDRCADLLVQFCAKLEAEKLFLIRAVRRVATLLWPEDKEFTDYWEGCCTQLEHEMSSTSKTFTATPR